MSSNSNIRERANSTPSVKEFLKRRREEVGNGEEEEVFRRSKITIKSPKKSSEEAQRADMEELKGMMAGLAKMVNDGFQESKNESKVIKEKLELMETYWNEKVHEMEKVIEVLSEKTNIQEDRITVLEEQLEKYEKNARANNIIIKNIPLQGNVTSEKIEEFLNRKLQIQTTVVEAFKIGKNTENRVVVAKLKDHGQKTKVMENKSKLKGTRTYIESDLTRKEKEIQNKIWTIASEMIKKGEKVKVGYQKMFKRDQVFIWDVNGGDLKLRSNTDQTAKN